LTPSRTRKMSRQQLNRVLAKNPLSAVSQFQIARRIMHTAGALVTGRSTAVPKMRRQRPETTLMPTRTRSAHAELSPQCAQRRTPILAR
jgi:hypothetical protein